jgi:hypothetical protein
MHRADGRADLISAPTAADVRQSRRLSLSTAGQGHRAGDMRELADALARAYAEGKGGPHRVD